MATGVGEEMSDRTIRVGSWNVRFGRADEQLVARHDLDLLCLQECTPAAFGRFGQLFDWAFSAMDRSWLGSVATNRRHGVAVLGKAAFRPTLLPPVPELLAPEKLLAVELEMTDSPGLTIANYHAYAGEKGEDGLDKPRLTSQVAAWLARANGPTILAMDTNSPWVDHPDPDLVGCCFDRPGARHFERGLLHPADKVHGLRDVLRTWLDANPDEFKRIRAERPAGPLAISHRTGRNASRAGNPRRYDHIYATSDFEIIDVRYLYDEAIDAGSDHALVLTDLGTQFL